MPESHYGWIQLVFYILICFKLYIITYHVVITCHGQNQQIVLDLLTMCTYHIVVPNILTFKVFYLNIV